MRPNEQHSALPEGLGELMIQLHSSCASSASIERIFLSFGLIHHKMRKRLGVEKAAKLFLSISYWYLALYRAWYQALLMFLYTADGVD